MPRSPFVHILDSHTEGEPTRVVVAGGPDLGTGPIAERQQRFAREFDGFRSGVVREPRGSDVVVGALLLEPVSPASAAAVIYFNDVGYLGMCGHGTIGVVTTLAHLGRIDVGEHQIETPVGSVRATLHPDRSVTVDNVPSYRYRSAVEVAIPQHGTVVGDIAWGGNWFFLVDGAPCELTARNASRLTQIASEVRLALQASGITGDDGSPIDHIEFFSPPRDPKNSARNFVLCPGASFDRSPCGTGSSAKAACLYADGKLSPGTVWRQEGILGTVFEVSLREANDGQAHPSIRGRAWMTSDTQLLFTEGDPFLEGIVLA